MIHLRKILKKNPCPAQPFPFSLPVLEAFRSIDFESPVTFFVGENGSGKSTILEAIAAGCRLPAVGGKDVERDETLVHARALAAYLSFSWTARHRRGFFLRAEDFFTFVRRIQTERRELTELEQDLGASHQGYGRQLAMGMARGQRSALEQRYGEDLDANSHGESFLKVFASRVVPNGLYVLDEPETPLSPQRQLALLAFLLDATRDGSQFIIATHSPILMAYPGADIYCFDQGCIRNTPYDQLDHVIFTRDFLNAPGRFLRHLSESED